jgi:ribulose-5-phosphate 4-epimerase/fuculose-1-phosphate aldolase
MDKLMRHLTAQPASESLSPSKVSTPLRQELKRELASAQRDRVREEYGYDLIDEANDPLVQVASDFEDEQAVKRPRTWQTASGNDETATDDLAEYRRQLSKACRTAWLYEVAGSRTDEDMASVFIPGKGYLYKPLGIRFDEVTNENLVFSARRDDLPKLHTELYGSNPGNTVLCVLSAAYSDCSLVALTKEGLLPLCQDAIRLYGRIRRSDDQNIGLRATRSTYKGTSCWLVKNRGVVCCEKSIEASLALLVLAARACSFQVRALGAVGGDLGRLDIPSESEVIRAKIELQNRISDEAVADSLFSRIS